MFKTVSITVHGFIPAEQIVSHLMVGCFVMVTPLPDDFYAIAVKPDALPTIEALASIYAPHVTLNKDT